MTKKGINTRPAVVRLLPSLSAQRSSLLVRVMRDLALTDTIRRLDAYWNIQSRILDRLTGYVDKVVPGLNGEPFLYSALRTAAERFNGVGANPSDRAHLRIFVAGLLVHADLLVRNFVWVVKDPEQDEQFCERTLHISEVESVVWEPFDEPVERFMHRHPGRRFRVSAGRFANVSANTSRLMLASRMLTVKDCACLGGDLDLLAKEAAM